MCRIAANIAKLPEQKGRIKQRCAALQLFLLTTSSA